MFKFEIREEVKIVITGFLNMCKDIIKILSIIMLGNSLIQATSIYSKSCNQVDIQDAINNAQNMDTVIIPEGEAVFKPSKDNQTPTKTFNPGITPSVLIWEKGLTIIGAGIGRTIVVDSTGSGQGRTAFYFTTKDSFNLHFSGFSIIGGETAAISVGGNSKSWRISNCEFISDKFKVGIGANSQAYGVISNCAFTNSRVLVEEPDYGHSSWKRPLNMGSKEAVYIEDCIFKFNVFGNVIDANSGGRYVFRFNTVVNSYVEAHSLQNGFSDGTFQRGTRSWEIYNNRFISLGNGATYNNWMAIYVRGGTGIIFGNRVENKSGEQYDGVIAVDNVRSFSARNGPLGMCDGSNPLDGNEDSTGYPCLDQIGRSTDHGPGEVRTPQLFEPLYVWDNTINNENTNIYVNNGELVKNHIKLNRDYYEGGVKPGYKPFQFPHPSRNKTIENNLIKPKNIRIYQN